MTFGESSWNAVLSNIIQCGIKWAQTQHQCYKTLKSWHKLLGWNTNCSKLSFFSCCHPMWWQCDTYGIFYTAITCNGLSCQQMMWENSDEQLWVFFQCKIYYCINACDVDNLSFMVCSWYLICYLFIFTNAIRI